MHKVSVVFVCASLRFCRHGKAIFSSGLADTFLRSSLTQNWHESKSLSAREFSEFRSDLLFVENGTVKPHELQLRLSSQ